MDLSKGIFNFLWMFPICLLRAGVKPWLDSRSVFPYDLTFPIVDWIYITGDNGALIYYVIMFLKLQTESCDWRSPQLVVAVGRRPQHLWSHRSPYLRPEAATVPCARRAQDSLSHRWLRNMWMIPYCWRWFDQTHIDFCRQRLSRDKWKTILLI